MEKLEGFIETFVTGDYFLIFIALIFMIIVVLVIALIKTKNDYNVLLFDNEVKNDGTDILDNIEQKNKEYIYNMVTHHNKEQENNQEPKMDDTQNLNNTNMYDFNNLYSVSDFDSLKATDKNDVFNEEEPLVKQIDVPKVKTYDDIIDEYESSEEENAVISAEELEKRTKERMETLGTSDNRIAIEKYEEEQEKKAIISYEQLLKNASNISLSYKEEPHKKDEPKINKIKIEQKEVSAAENYLEEVEYLKILKSFRMSLE